MKRFLVSRSVDYIAGHLRYGHRETEVEAESREELEEKLKDTNYVDEIFEDSDTIVDDYEIDDVGEYCDDAYIVKEIVSDEYNYEYGIDLLNEIKSRLGGPQPSDTGNAINKAIELFKERIK